jgi:septal ring factor EnvC (AmiA/AmiB activator)
MTLNHKETLMPEADKKVRRIERALYKAEQRISDLRMKLLAARGEQLKEQLARRESVLP